MSRSLCTGCSILLELFGILFVLAGSAQHNAPMLTLGGFLFGILVWLCVAAVKADNQEQKKMDNYRDVIEQLSKQNKG